MTPNGCGVGRLVFRLCEPCMLDPGCGFCYRENGSALLTSSCVPVNKASTEQAAWGRWVTGCCASACRHLGGSADLMQEHITGPCAAIKGLVSVSGSFGFALADVPTPAWWKNRPTGPTTTVPPPTPGWFCWVWCSTWLLLLQVSDQHSVWKLVPQCHVDETIHTQSVVSSSQGWAPCRGPSIQRSTLCGRGAQATPARPESTGPSTSWCRWPSSTWLSTLPIMVSFWAKPIWRWQSLKHHFFPSSLSQSKPILIRLNTLVRNNYSQP